MMMKIQQIDRTFILIIAGNLTLITAFPVLAEIPITGGEIKGAYIYQSPAAAASRQVSDVRVDSFYLNTPNGKLASPQVQFDNARNVLLPFANTPQGRATVDLSGMAFTSTGEVVMFSKVPTSIQGRLDLNSGGGSGLVATGTVIIEGGTFNLGSKTVNDKNGRTFDDSTLFFEDVGSTGKTKTEVVTIGSEKSQAQDLAKNQAEQQRLEQQAKQLESQRAAAEQERIRLEAQFNQLAMKQTIAEKEDRDLQNRLAQLTSKQATADAIQESLKQLLESAKMQKIALEDKRSNLNLQNQAFDSRLSTLASQQQDLLGREGQLVALINKIVNDKSVAKDIAKIQKELESFSSKINNRQKFALLLNDLRSARTAFDVAINILPYSYESFFAKEDLPPEVGNPLGAISTYDSRGGLNPKKGLPTLNIKALNINFDPLKALFGYFNLEELKASNIADWIIGASQAVADAKLQEIEQRANVVKQLSENLRETRNALKQLDVAIQQTTQQKQQFQAQITANQQEISKAELNIQQLQEKSNNNQQQISQIDQQIQQTNSEIAAKQQQLEQNGQQLKDAKESIDMNKADTSENQEKINQLAQDANQMKTQQNQTSNARNSGRAEPLSSNIFPATSMRQ